MPLLHAKYYVIPNWLKKIIVHLGKKVIAEKCMALENISYQFNKSGTGSILNIIICFIYIQL